MTETPTILHLSSAISWRGGEQQLAYLCHELKNKNVKQAVACPQNSALFKKLEQEAFDLLIPYKKTSGLNLSLAFLIPKICKKIKADIVHVHDSHAHTAAFIAALLGHKTPIILSRRVDFPVGDNFFSRWKYNHPSIAAIACVSDAIKAVMKTAVKNHDKLLTIHSGIDLSKQPVACKSNKLRTELNFPKDAFIIGNTSALADHKDYFTFVDTAERVLQRLPNVRFVIVGDGPLKNVITDYIWQKGLAEKILMLGFRSDVKELLGGFDVFFMSSKTEGLGTSILDAFACGIPVVATNAGGIPEIVVHEQTGLTASVKDTSNLTAHLTALYHNENLRNKLTEAARKKLEDFSTVNTARKTLALYKDILNRRSY